MDVRSAALALLAAGLTSSCARRAVPEARDGDVASPAPGIAITHWVGDDARGLSGLARHPDGSFWSVPERVRGLVVFSFRDQRAERRPATLPIEGVAPSVDLESAAWIDDERLALGTEAAESGRAEDLILIGRPRAGRFRAEETIHFPYAPWGLRAARNEGIEGLCFARGVLIVGAEPTIKAGEDRFAPIGLYDLETKQWTARKLRFFSREGKISSLACRDRSGRIEVLAIERHFSTMLILRFFIDDPKATADIHPELVCDLNKTGVVQPNWEGIEWLADDRLVLVSDNDYHGVTGPTEVAVLELERMKPTCR
jgi:hypothetical protein